MAKILKLSDLPKVDPKNRKGKKPSGAFGCMKGQIYCRDYKKVFNLL